MHSGGRLAVAGTATLLWLIALTTVLAQGVTARADDSEAARRRRIENMSPAEKHRLLRRHQRFAGLDQAEQQRLWQLHRQLERDPKLRRVMHAYCQWLKDLPPYLRDELLELQGAERVERIKQLRAEEAAREANRPKREDMEGLSRWMEQYVKEHEDRLLRSLPEPLRKKLTRLDFDRRRGWITWLTWQRWQMGRPGTFPLPDMDDLKELRSNLSDQTRRRLEAEPPEKQWQDISGWVRQAFRQRIGSRHFRGPSPPELQEELDHFFEKELSDQERDRLLSLPGEEMQRELRRAYLRFRFPDSPNRGPYRPGYRRPPDPGDPRHPHSKPPRPGPSPGVRPPGPRPNGPPPHHWPSPAVR